MGLRIDPARVSPTRPLAEASAHVATGFRRLAAGLRIATAADDPAGLGHAEALRARVRSLDQARRNAADGLSLVQAAEGSLAEVADIATRMRQLLVQAQNAGTTAAERTQIEHDFGELGREANRIALSATWNGHGLLDGSSSILDLQIGAGSQAGVDTLRIELRSALATTVGLMAATEGDLPLPDTGPHPPPVPWSLSVVDVSAMDQTIAALSGTRASLEASRARLNSVIATLATDSEHAGAAAARVRDVDVAATTAETVRAAIVRDAGLGTQAQAHAHARRVLDLFG